MLTSFNVLNDWLSHFQCDQTYNSQYYPDDDHSVHDFTFVEAFFLIMMV